MNERMNERTNVISNITHEYAYRLSRTPTNLNPAFQSTYTTIPKITSAAETVLLGTRSSGRIRKPNPRTHRSDFDMDSKITTAI